SEKFVCIIDPAKQVDVLGRFPLPVEVVPMARSLVARASVAATGAQPVWREGAVTDNGNWILDVHGLRITEPLVLERELNQLPGLVSVGLFAGRPADTVIAGTGPPPVRGSRLPRVGFNNRNPSLAKPAGLEPQVCPRPQRAARFNRFSRMWR